MRELRVVKVTPGKLVHGRFVPNPENITRAVKKAKRKRLEEMIREATKNPASKKLPTGKFVKVHAMRVRKNGTVDVVVTK
jgi:hypothetical protein